MFLRVRKKLSACCSDVTTWRETATPCSCSFKGISMANLHMRASCMWSLIFLSTMVSPSRPRWCREVSSDSKLAANSSPLAPRSSISLSTSTTCTLTTTNASCWKTFSRVALMPISATAASTFVITFSVIAPITITLLTRRFAVLANAFPAALANKPVPVFAVTFDFTTSFLFSSIMLRYMGFNWYCEAKGGGFSPAVSPETSLYTLIIALILAQFTVNEWRCALNS
mmetsp:Transcript_6669/g.14603  ORF Transcript_6669/g.14603 Transcript_6669/m.14603 type:complete len:227 (-) Transcript_6669:44-724(-)